MATADDLYQTTLQTIEKVKDLRLEDLRLKGPAQGVANLENLGWKGLITQKQK